MWLIFALIAALLTSFLPIVNKRLLADTPVSVVAWGVNALSLPLLVLASIVLFPFPAVDGVFWLGILGSAVLNLAATLVSTQALKLGEASVVTPLLTFNPAFTLLIATFTLGEKASWVGLVGVLTILTGSYVLTSENSKGSFLQPLTSLVTQPAMLLALLASCIWGLTPIAEKLAIRHSSPANPPLVAFGSTALMAVFLLPVMVRQAKRPLGYFLSHRQGFLTAALIAGIAPVFGFTAISTGLVGYVSAIFKLSTVFTVVWAILLLQEHATKERLGGAILMVVGAILIGI